MYADFCETQIANTILLKTSNESQTTFQRNFLEGLLTLPKIKISSTLRKYGRNTFEKRDKLMRVSLLSIMCTWYYCK